MPLLNMSKYFVNVRHIKRANTQVRPVGADPFLCYTFTNIKSFKT